MLPPANEPAKTELEATCDNLRNSYFLRSLNDGYGRNGKRPAGLYEWRVSWLKLIEEVRNGTTDL